MFHNPKKLLRCFCFLPILCIVSFTREHTPIAWDFYIYKRHTIPSSFKKCAIIFLFHKTGKICVYTTTLLCNFKSRRERFEIIINFSNVNVRDDYKATRSEIFFVKCMIPHDEEKLRINLVNKWVILFESIGSVRWRRCRVRTTIVYMLTFEWSINERGNSETKSLNSPPRKEPQIELQFSI